MRRSARATNDALMFDYRGQVAEATGANVFFVKDGALHTPTPDCFLDGITRRTVMDLARARQIKVHERAIFPNELEGFEQCFLTGTAAEVSPVGEIGPLPLRGRRDHTHADVGLRDGGARPRELQDQGRRGLGGSSDPVIAHDAFGVGRYVREIRLIFSKVNASNCAGANALKTSMPGEGR